ncbi:cytidine deaminase [Reichenbachiella agariperforans]|uniref:Cytidine deaminase n=1 Tax=Reichenbachiella agariperforans TaxID=156994 RepID=A0A1M6JJZ5_REIAG|nr:cytidine deaminase [Reichenbachiella agariperforans]SHJ46942.1 cytidine deaminase [Reichenbachiella agariperforans]
MSDQKTEQLIEQAKQVARHAYSPYSRFKVGAALMDQYGNIYSGCNVENISFPCVICAETSAIAQAVSSAGSAMKIDTLVIYTPTASITSPCGNCRQVIHEFSTSATKVICVCNESVQLTLCIEELLPHATNISLDK